ncbi:MAG TPA: tetratricopeptide repeat protein [Anaerolineales bacterium]|nr:tetratricopeptide repeat protein [Anaerolineae bacterium]HIQ00526.1 tetratricopeptide repeat protein [Anaerolineales bacterium]
MSSTRLSALLDGILEAGWLSAIVVTPLFFNIYSSRIFEPDKLTTLRSIALVMAAAWLARWIEERAGGQRPLRITRRTPLVLPTLFTVLVYLVSTLFSVTPHTSFFGSYQRLQGTFTTLSYIVIFLIVLDRMRTRAQVDRFITTLILNSLPIALYGFVQHSRRDPLPWGGDVTKRVASNMGNAIFVAAYLIMVVPPTLARIVHSFRSILTDEETGTADVLRAAAYIFIFLVQVIAIWYTKSRGPLMGLLVGLSVWVFLGLLSLQHTARRASPLQPNHLLGDLGRGLAFGLGSLAAAGTAAGLLYLASRAVAAPGSSLPQWIGMGTALLVLSGGWLTFIVNRWGYRWLWIGALLIGILFAAGLLSINLVEPIHAWSQQQPWMGRLDDVLQAESGTGKVRSLLWQQALDLILPHEPLEYPPTAADPEGHPDRFNSLRPLAGYGPESMFVAANRFYPPLLGHYEARTASGDRAHNETLDTLVITGLLGFAAYLWLFGSLFYFGLRWLGFLPDGRRRPLFFALLILGAAIAVAVVIPATGPHFFGLAVPVGMTGGLLLYLILHGFSAYRKREDSPALHPDSILLTGILATFVAHLIEINFGIAIAATRTTFWALAGTFVVVGLQWLVEEEKHPAASPADRHVRDKRRKKRRRQPVPSRPRRAPRSTTPPWLWPSLGAALIGALILGTLAYDFVNNVERLTDPLQILWRSLAVVAIPANRPPRSSLGILMVFGMTWLTTGLLTVAQMVKRGSFRERRGEEWAAALVVLSLPLVAGTAFGLALAGRHAHAAGAQIQTIADALRLSEYVAGQVGAYYLFLAAVLLLGGAALTGERALPKRWGTIAGTAVALVLLVVVPTAAYQLNLRPILADIVYKQGDPWERQGQWAVAIQHYQRAIELAPQEDFYHLYLGRAYLEYATSLDDPIQQDLVMRETERVLLTAQALNPLNTDHSANLARMYSRWSGLPAGREHSQALAELSSHYYDTATRLSPHNAILWNEWARLYHYILGDEEGFQRTINRSLELDPEFEQTWLLIGDVRLEEGDLEGTVEAYRTALEIRPRQPHVWNALGRVYLQLGRPQEAIEALSQALELAPNARDAWDTHRLLAIAYHQTGDPIQALIEAQIALQMAPEDQRPLVEELLQQLQQPPPGETSP